MIAIKQEHNSIQYQQHSIYKEFMYSLSRLKHGRLKMKIYSLLPITYSLVRTQSKYIHCRIECVLIVIASVQFSLSLLWLKHQQSELLE